MQTTSVVPTSPTAKLIWVVSIRSVIVPPSTTRTTTGCNAVATQTPPSASTQIPSGAIIWPRRSAHTRRLLSEPSSATSNAVSRNASVSATTSVPSGQQHHAVRELHVLGGTRTVPSGSTRRAACPAARRPGRAPTDAVVRDLLVQVEPEVADVGPAAGVDQHVVGVERGDVEQVRVQREHPVRLQPAHGAVLHRHHEQPAVGQPAEARRLGGQRADDCRSPVSRSTRRPPSRRSRRSRTGRPARASALRRSGGPSRRTVVSAMVGDGSRSIRGRAER